MFFKYDRVFSKNIYLVENKVEEKIAREARVSFTEFGVSQFRSDVEKMHLQKFYYDTYT